MQAFNNILSNDDELYLILTNKYIIRYYEALYRFNLDGTPIPPDALIPAEVLTERDAARARLASS